MRAECDHKMSEHRGEVRRVGCGARVNVEAAKEVRLEGLCASFESCQAFRHFCETQTIFHESLRKVLCRIEIESEMFESEKKKSIVTLFIFSFELRIHISQSTQKINLRRKCPPPARLLK